MKKQTYLFQKFQKKYLFFQKNFFDFFYLRSKKSSHFMKNSSSEFFNIKKPFYLFEQENIGFSETFQNPEKKQIKNMFQNLQNSNLNSKKKVFQKVSKQSKKVSSNSSRKLCLKIFKKRRKSKTNSQDFESSAGMHFPKNSSFEIFQNLQSFQFQQIGEFFPKRKNFLQYWVFPFLGIFFFFSNNTSVLFLSPNIQKKSEIQSKQFFIAMPSEKLNSKAKFGENDSSFSFFGQNSGQETLNSSFTQQLNKTRKMKIQEQDFQIFFAGKDSKKFVQSFQTFEKNEFEEFFKFSTKIFQNIFHGVPFLPFEQKEKDFFKQISLQNSVFKKDFQKKIEMKRNHFHWTWFSAYGMNFSSFFEKTKSDPIFHFNISLPQKANFFLLHAEENSPFFFAPVPETAEKEKKSSFQAGGAKTPHFQKKKKQKQTFFSTPVFEFSKNISFIDDSQRKSNLLQSRDKVFFEKDDFLFLNSFFSNVAKKENFKQFLFLPLFQKNREFSSLNFNKDPFLEEISFSSFADSPENIPSFEKTLFFLKNWGETQKFWNFKMKKTNLFQFKKKKKVFDFLNLSKIKQVNNLRNLDTLYFQKMFTKLSHPLHVNFSSRSQSSFFSSNDSLQTFSKTQTKIPKQHSFFFEKEKPFIWSDKFKKQTFDFFVFQHYHAKYKKLLTFQQNSFFPFSRKTEKQTNFSSFCLDPIFFEKNQKEQLNSSFSQGKNFFFNLSGQKKFIEEKPVLFKYPILFGSLKSKLIPLFPFSQTMRNGNSFFEGELNSSLHTLPATNNHKVNGKEMNKNPFLFEHPDDDLFVPFQKKSDKFVQSSIFFYETKNKNFFQFFPNFQQIQKDSKNFSFYFSNFTFFEKLFDKLFKNIAKNSLSKFSALEDFEKLFLFETTKFEKPLFYSEFQKSLKPFNGTKMLFSKKEKMQFSISTNVLVLKAKKDFLFSFQKLQKPNISKKYSSRFQKTARNFEKVFQTFFSPLKNEKNLYSSNFSHLVEREKKYQTDPIFLKNLSYLFKKDYDSFDIKRKNFSFFHEFSQCSSFFVKDKGKKQRNLSQSSEKKENSFYESLNTVRTKNRISPKLFLKKDGFVFFSSKNRKIQNKKFLRFEKEKIFQKKRRLKKEKLETRRRKKRKRFFPRPIWLRMNLYKKFLKKRHFQPVGIQFDKSKKLKNESSFHFSLGKAFLKNQKSTFLMKTYGKNFQKFGFYWKSGFSQKQDIIFSTKSSKNFKFLKNYFSLVETLPKFEKNIFFLPFSPKTSELIGKSLSGEKPIFSKNIEYYKISGSVFREFLRFSWKSSWFQTNFQSSMKKIQESFQEMQSVEAKLNFSKSKNFVFFFSKFPIFSEEYENHFLLQKSVLDKFLWYSNIRNSMEGNLVVCEAGKNYSNFQKIEKIPEYNRILYARVSEILRNFKFSENTTKTFFFKQLQAQRRKNEKIFSGSNDSFFTKSALFFEKFQVPSEPKIPAFSIFSSLFNDSSIKPTGEIPTLRALWAFQKTNMFHFQETNFVRNLWTQKKRNDALKSLKGAKILKNFSRKYSGFETFKRNTPFFEFQKIFENSLPMAEKNSFLLHSLSGKPGNFDQMNQLEKMTFKKFQNVEKKVSVFGIQSLKQNSKKSLRSFKFHLSKISLPAFEVVPNSFFLNTLKKQRNQSFSFAKKEKFIKNSEYFNFVKNKNNQNSAKSSLNFWWSQKPEQQYAFLGTSFFKTFEDFSFEKDQFVSDFFFKQTNKFSKNQEQKIFSNISFSFFVIGSLFFQYALFASFFKIPEIRSVFKFQCLIFSKILKSFFVLFFSLYNLLKKYVKNGVDIFKNSKVSFFELKSFSSVSTEKNQYEPNLFFSSKKFTSEMNFHQYILFEKIQKHQLVQNKNFSKQFLFQFFPRFSLFSTSIEKISTQKFQKKILSVSKKSKIFVFGANQAPYTKEIFSPFSLTIPKNMPDLVWEMKQQQMKSFKNFDSSIFFTNFKMFSKKNKYLSFQQKNQQDFSLFLHSHSLKNEKPFENLSSGEKNISFFTLSFLVFGKSILLIPYRILKIGSNFSIKIFEIFESFFFAVYKFLEKPAEFMIEFIAFVFLIEWSSDVVSFLPDSVETSFWKTSQKLLRPVRIGSFALNIGKFPILPSSNLPAFSVGNPVLFGYGKGTGTLQNIFLGGPFHFLFSAGLFTSANFVAFLLQKRLFYFFEYSPSILFQPDIDILIRQKKGLIFWDIWAEVLLKAAEKYNVNIPSFVTLKEEQEVFVEKLVRDSDFFHTFQSDSFYQSFFQNFVLRNVPSSFFDSFFVSMSNSSIFQKFLFSKNTGYFQVMPKAGTQKKLKQSSISNLFILDNFQNFSNMQNIQEKNSVSDPKSDLLFGKKTNPFLWNVPFKFAKNLPVEKTKAFHTFFQPNGGFRNLDRWQSNQYATFQSQETDFFLDIYLPKSLRHVHFLKYYEPAHFPLGSLICQIYGGIFSKQVSKNVLVVGESGTAKTLFLQAFAGETEMKIITENAARYALVQRGVAVGMKFLRDVFDAIALQTPCFFVMEDLHILGSKRPFLISETENGKGNLSSFGLEQQEVHETNQMIYQSSCHSITDFRRPYKGDFSMAIPTNFFLQTFYSSFLGSSQNVSKNSLGEIEKNSSFYTLQKNRFFQNFQFFGGNFSSNIHNYLSSPFPIDSLENLLQNQGVQENQKFSRPKFMQRTQSCLQLSKEQIFAPPATSPFTVLMMKEQKKLKPKKRVEEMSWGGLSVDQMLSYQKESSSVRAKVAILAEKTLSFSHGKFDMITDFLVIIDSVRSNRGFVVFGTTHKPSLLDPALRRPGRFDETLSLSIHPNFLNRFEIFKMNFENGISTFDFLDSSFLTENFSEMDLFNLISQTKLSFFHIYKYPVDKSIKKDESFLGFLESFSQKIGQNFVPITSIGSLSSSQMQEQHFSHICPETAFHDSLKVSFFEDFYSQKEFSQNHKQKNKKIAQIPLLGSNSQCMSQKSKIDQTFENFDLKLEHSRFRNKNLLRYSILPKGSTHILSRAYSKIGVFLAESSLFQNPTCFIPLSLDFQKNFSAASGTGVNLNFSFGGQQFFGNIFYNSRKQQNSQMMVFLSGKISEFLVEKNIFVSQSFSSIPFEIFSPVSGTGMNLFEKPSNFFVTKFGTFDFSSLQKDEVLLSSKQQNGFFLNSKDYFVFKKSQLHCETKDFQKFQLTKINSQKQQRVFDAHSSNILKKNFYWTAFGNDEIWRFTTPFLFSIVRKRFLFTKNLLLSKMLFFENSNSRRQPPIPPASSILMPAKKYENFKRTENDFFQKGRFSINEKIQMHQKQRFLKQLYNIPVQQFFNSQFRKNHKTLFSTSFQELAYFDSFVQTSSSSLFYQKKYVQTRHRFSHINQWWNGMFPEHTREATYLSDVDWRTMFVSLKNPSFEKNVSSNLKDKKINSFQKANMTFEFLMDFPDSEQYYSPRNQRWFFRASAGGTKTNSFTNQTIWAIFEKDLQYEIFYHFLMESFHKSYSFFDKQREMLDFFVYQLFEKGILREFDFLTTFSRF